jgi:hypothetical protein
MHVYILNDFLSIYLNNKLRVKKNPNRKTPKKGTYIKLSISIARPVNVSF